jgi:undecaprenyl-diphosphatase
MAEFLEIIILSAIQGISEFIPVSSSAHLYLISEVQNFEIKSLLTDVSLHLGSLLAILFYFKENFLKLFKDKKLLKLLVFGSLPLVLVGFVVFKTGLINHFRNIEIIAWTTIIFAIFLYIADKFTIRKKIETDLNLRSIFVIGIFQVLALIPGVSRAGIVITAGRLLNFDRYDSTKISFYLSVPAIAGASFLSLKELTFSNIEVNFIVLLAVICSFIFSYITIKFFLIFVKKFSMNIFVIYRVFLGLILFWFIYT